MMTEVTRPIPHFSNLRMSGARRKLIRTAKASGRKKSWARCRTATTTTSERRGIPRPLAGWEGDGEMAFTRRLRTPNEGRAWKKRAGRLDKDTMDRAFPWQHFHRCHGKSVY